MRDDPESYPEALRRIKRAMGIPPSGEQSRQSIGLVDRPAKRADTVSDPVLSEKTRVVLNITTALAVVGFLVVGGIKYGEWSSERSAILAVQKLQDERLARLEDRMANLDKSMGHFSDEQDHMAADMKTLLRHSDALLWTHGKGNPASQSDE